MRLLFKLCNNITGLCSWQRKTIHIHILRMDPMTALAIATRMTMQGMSMLITITDILTVKSGHRRRRSRDSGR